MFGSNGESSGARIAIVTSATVSTRPEVNAKLRSRRLKRFMGEAPHPALRATLSPLRRGEGKRGARRADEGTRSSSFELDPRIHDPVQQVAEEVDENVRQRAA